MKYFLLLTILTVSFFTYISTPKIPDGEQAQGKPYHHLASGHFRNPEGSLPKKFTRSRLLKFLWQGKTNPPEVYPIPEGHVIPQQQAMELLNNYNDVDSVTWLGHSSFLIQVDGKTILTDPFLTERAGVGPLGPSRFIAPGIDITNLPPIDIIIIGHNHYDHLDMPTLKQLANKQQITVVVPLELGSLVKKAGYQHIYELDWHDSVVLDDITITALPAMHWSRRGLFDTNETLWASYAINSSQQQLYFSSDSGYHETVFKEIGTQYGPFDMALISIGAYEPREIMQASHVNPEEVILVAQDIQAKRIIGMHWGTIVLTREPVWQPPQRFKTAGLNGGYQDEDLWVMAIGESRAIN